MADPRYERLQARLGGAGGEPPMDPMMMDPAMANPEMTMEEGAEAGREGDTILAHLTPGELVVPLAMLQADEEFAMFMQTAFEEAGVPFNQYVVGHEENSINPETGHPEFGFLSSVGKFFKKSVKKVTGWGKDIIKGTRQVVGGAVGMLTGQMTAKDYERMGRQQSADMQRIADQQHKRTLELYERQKKDMARERTRFRSEMNAANARMNLQLAEQQKKAKFDSVRSQRKFARTLTGMQGDAKAVVASKEAASVGGSSPSKKMKTAIGARTRKRKAAPRFTRRTRGGSRRY